MGGFVYVVQGEKILKVGRSVDAKKRLNGIKKEFEKYGDSVKNFAYFDADGREHSAEYRLIDEIAKTHLLYMGREWFHAKDFETAKRIAEKACADAKSVPRYIVKPLTSKQREKLEFERKEKLRLSKERRAQHAAKHAKEVARKKLIRTLRQIELACIDMWKNKQMGNVHA